MCVRSGLSLLAFILGGGLLFIIGAVVVLAYRDRRYGFSYFAYGMTTAKLEDHVAVALARRRASWRRPIQISCSEPCPSGRANTIGTACDPNDQPNSVASGHP